MRSVHLITEFVGVIGFTVFGQSLIASNWFNFKYFVALSMFALATGFLISIITSFDHDDSYQPKIALSLHWLVADESLGGFDD